MKTDDRGYTALHSTAMSSFINPTIVSLLLSTAEERGEKFRFLNQQSNVDSGRNTALHVAAGNPGVTSEFLEEFRDADPRIQNAEMDTPFHVAAKSTNPDAIVYFLATFKSSNSGLDIDILDANRGDKAATLVNTCASNGNAQAVALLMQQGADISQGALGEIVMESVKKPEMIDSFLAVYQTVVDNAVAWKCLKEHKKSLMRGSTEYNTAQRQIMIYLTTKPHDGKNMIQRCFELGASDLLSAILNTDNVYRFDEFGVQKNDPSNTICSYSRFDVTDFTRLSRDPATTPGGPNSHPLRKMGHDFTTQFHPKTTYLDELLMHFDEWRNTDLFTSQPMRTLTQPYFGFVQRYYFVIGLIQLLFMVFFSANFTPDSCSLAKMFGSSVSSSCNQSLDVVDDGDGNSTMASPTSVRYRPAPLFLWLIWPTILFAGSIVDCLVLSLWYTGINLFHSEHSTAKKTNFSQLRRPRSESTLMRMLLASFHVIPLLAFCVSFLTWYDRYSNAQSRQSYLEATAMVFLFGWMTNFVLFSGITKELHVFLMVLKEIIVKDMILNFSLVFIFTVIAFSCTLHSLRMMVVSHQDVFTRTTIYEIFMSALGVGDFIERITEDSEEEEMESSMGLLFAVYAMYICFTLIILMNILIAMLSNRYEDARQRAENVWRFETVKTAQIIEDFNVFRKFIHIDDLTYGYLGCLFRCRRQVYQDPDFPGREFVDVQLKLENSESD